MELVGRITLDQLRTFHTVARLKSFTLAAEELNLSQPAVSVQIRALEREVGTQLFGRVGKRLLLTQEGEVVLSCAADILRRLEDTGQELDDLQGLRRGNLALGATQVAGIYALPEILRRFKERYPGIKIALQIGFGEEMAELVLNGTIDLALLGERETLKDERLAVRRFAVDELVVVTNSQHEWAGRRSVSLAELPSQPFIISREGSSIWRTIDRRLQREGIKLDSSLRFGSADGVKRAVEIGLGISVILRMGITREEVESGRLKVLKLEGIPTEFELCFAWLKDRHLPKVVEAFLAFVDQGDPGNK